MKSRTLQTSFDLVGEYLGGLFEMGILSHRLSAVAYAYGFLRALDLLSLAIGRQVLMPRVAVTEV